MRWSYKFGGVSEGGPEIPSFSSSVLPPEAFRTPLIGPERGRDLPVVTQARAKPGLHREG